MSKLQALLTIAAVLCVGNTSQAQWQNGECSVGARSNVGYTPRHRAGDYGYSQFRPQVEFTGGTCSFSQACRDCGRTNVGYQPASYAPNSYRTNWLDSACRDCNDPNCRCDASGAYRRSNYRSETDFGPDFGYRSRTDPRMRLEAPSSSDFDRYEDFRSRDYDRNQRPRVDYPDLRYPSNGTTSPRYNYTSTRPTAIRWQTDLRRAAEQARVERRPMVVVFGAEWCTYCKRMKAETFSDSRFVSEVARSQFVPVQVDADRNQQIVTRLGIRSLPTTLIVGSDLKIVERVQGFRTAEQMTQLLSRHRRSAEKDVDMKVAAK